MESSIEELFNAINNSNEYKEYKQIVDIIEEDNDIKNLIEEIKKLQKEAILKAQELRKTGALIELLCMDETKSKEDYQAYADRTGMTKITYMDGE